MPKLRTGRQRYYNVFASFYDLFIQIHSGRQGHETRSYLVDSVQVENSKQTRILDVCCGTGSVILAFAEKYSNALTLGYDFSMGMLRQVRKKDAARQVALVQGDAAHLPYSDNCFDLVSCSHALYELKGQGRTDALMEMQRVVKPGGKVLIMEHEVPRNPLVRMLFNLRLRTMGSADANEFIQQDLSPYQKIFTTVTLSHTPSGKSKLITCQKQ